MDNTEKIDTLVVGAGQAGLAMSEHLSNHGIDHLILERDRIAERWRTARWDSLVANGPAWHDRFPTLEFQRDQPDDFPNKDNVVDYFETFAKSIKAPIRCGVEVRRLQRNPGQAGFRVETSDSVIEARRVVCATGPFQQPNIPPIVPAEADLLQIHSTGYRNPAELPDGSVMVIGAGSSGAQIADELSRAGKHVYLSVGPHDRPPRSYRGKDFVWWLGVLGKWDIATPDPDTAHVTIAVSGARGGETIDFRNFADQGITLLGMTESYNNGVMHFRKDLVENIANGDANYLLMLDEADRFIERNGLDFPEEPQARVFGAEATCISNPVLELDMTKADVKTIIWATGFSHDYGWLDVDVLDKYGSPQHQRGVTKEPGIYFLGLPWLSRRGSSFIWGVWHDAKYLADQIAIQRSYMDYHNSSGP